MKKHVAILFGGRSDEHPISLCSAWNVISTLDRDLFNLTLIGIAKTGEWFLQDEADFLDQEAHAKTIRLKNMEQRVFLSPNPGGAQFSVEGKTLDPVDVIFPMLHGPFGEDGTIQGLAETLNIPFAGCGVLSSAMCMDKESTKRIMRDNGIPTSRFLSYVKSEQKDIDFASAERELGLPMFIKPANQGSSFGVSKVNVQSDFLPAIEKAFKYDDKLLIEEFVDGRELEIALLGNANPKVSVPGEHVYEDKFFTFETKYIDTSKVEMAIPAHNLSEEQQCAAQDMAVRAFQALQCSGFARIDIFEKPSGELLVNEINTIPGFTNSSMFPLLMQDTGMTYKEILTEIIELAIES